MRILRLTGVLSIFVLSTGVSSVSLAATVTVGLLPVGGFANPLATSTVGAVEQNISDSACGYRLNPWEPRDCVGASQLYSSIPRGASATFEFTGLMTDLSLVWGSRGPLDLIEFIVFNPSHTATVVDSFGGYGQIGWIDNNHTFMSFSQIANGGVFNAIRLSAGDNSLEFGNLSATVAAVPVPAAGVGFLSGLAALVMLRGKKSRGRTKPAR